MFWIAIEKTYEGFARSFGSAGWLGCLLSAAVFVSPATATAEIERDDVVAPGKPAIRSTRGIRTMVGFVENRGQWSPEVLYFARAGGVEATVTREALVLRSTPPDPESGRPCPTPIVLRWPGGGETTVIGEGLTATEHNYLLGSDRTRWGQGARGYERVRYRGVLPGVDVVLRVEPSPDGVGERFAYDLHFSAGARVEEFELEVDGLKSASMSSSTMTMETVAGEIVEQRIGESWQVSGGDEPNESIAATFGTLGTNSRGSSVVGFEAPGRDPSRAFVLDPSLVWSTYLGGSTLDALQSMDVDASGSTHLLCWTWSGTPTTPGAFQPTIAGNYDVWVGKLSPNGGILQFATFLGGAGPEWAVGVDVDEDGTVVVVGRTHSADFPTTPSSLQPVIGAPDKTDSFVTRLDPTGSSMVWSTFYGGLGGDGVTASELLPNGDIVLAIFATSTTPTSDPESFDSVFDLGDKALVRISADGTQRLFQTYFKTGRILDIAIDDDENIYFTGDISGTEGPLPATPGAFKTSTSGALTKSEGYVAKLSGDGTFLYWATYLGGDDKSDTIWGIAVDAAHAVYVSGQTDSIEFPITENAFGDGAGDTNDGFVTKLLPGGSGLVWSTYLGTCCGGAASQEWQIVVDPAGNAISIGSANEPNFPTTPDAFQPNFIGSFLTSDVHFTKFDAFGESLVYSTWIGGSGTDYFPYIDLDEDQDLYVAFQSYSTDAPTTPGAYDTTANGSLDMVAAKFDLPLLPWRVLSGGKPGSTDTPNLAGGGALTAGTTARMSIRGGYPTSFTLLFAGFTALNAPLIGGTFVPSPDLIVPMATDGSGAIDLSFLWPAAPAGIDLYIQAWIADPGASLGWSASNALRLSSQ